MKFISTICLTGALVIFAESALGDCFTGEPPCDTARPEEGIGAVFVDELGLPFFAFSDLDFDSLVAQFEGDPSDWISQSPNGRTFIHFNDDKASIRAEVGGLVYWSLSPLLSFRCDNIATCPGIQGGPVQVSYTANCSLFEPATPEARCTFGEGLISINVHAEGFREADGAICDISAHLTGQFVDDGSLACSLGSESCIEFPNDRNQIDISVDCK